MSISPQSLARTRDKRSLKVPARFDDNEFSTNLMHLRDTYKLTNEKRQNDCDASDHDEVIKRSSFHPSITIRNPSVKFNEPATKPLVEQRPNSAATPPPAEPTPTTCAHPSPQSPTRISSSRKKSKGFSLMVKPNGVQGNTPVQQQVNPQQQAKFFNNLTSNMQYGTRLMLNEPVYLPRSVNPIAPITVTLQQIANQARKPPYISKKAEAFIKYQDDRKLNYIASSHSALVRITRFICVKDRINLRCVNTTWKSIIDSELVWRKVLVNSNDQNISWATLFSFLSGYHMTDIVIEEYIPKRMPSDVKKLGLDILCCTRCFKRLWLKSSSPEQNSFAFLLLKSFGSTEVMKYIKQQDYSNKTIELYWRVKVCVDDFGVATLDMAEFKDGCLGGNSVVKELYDLEMELEGLYKAQTKLLKRQRPFIKLDIKPV